jgi:hypothetical protein
VSQVDIQPDALGVNVCNPLSTIAVNDVGDVLNTVHVQSTTNAQGVSAITGYAFDQTVGPGATTGLNGVAFFGGTSNRAIGVRAVATRDANYSVGRSYGIYGVAGNSTAGANYGGFNILVGGNSGAAIVGYDSINHGGWSQVMSSVVSYAGYFRGKGYFHDNVGIGEENPQSKLHIEGGDIFVEGSVNGIILDSGSGCYKITVDASGVLSTISVSCP